MYSIRWHDVSVSPDHELRHGSILTNDGKDKLMHIIFANQQQIRYVNRILSFKLCLFSQGMMICGRSILTLHQSLVGLLSLFGMIMCLILVRSSQYFNPDLIVPGYLIFQLNSLNFDTDLSFMCCSYRK